MNKNIILEKICAYCTDPQGYVLISDAKIINQDYNPMCKPNTSIIESYGLCRKCEPEVYKQNGLELEYKIIQKNRKSTI